MKKFLTLLVWLTVSVTFAQNVTFINPGRSDETFWVMVSNFMQAAADDLSINLEIIYSERDHVLMQKQAEDVVNRTTPPDYMIIVNEKLVAPAMIQAAADKDVNVFMIINALNDEQTAEYGTPGQYYSNWIGTIKPNNFSAGYLIAKQVIDKSLSAGRFAPDGSLHLLGVTGDKSTPAAVERTEGLLKAVSEYDNVKLLQVVPGHWNQSLVEEKTTWLLRRYPDIRAIWAANDPMALGAMAGVNASSKVPGKDIYFGGLNWSGDALQEVRQGAMVTTVGGHFMTAGWAMVVLYDHFRGFDFTEAEMTRASNQAFGVINASNVEGYLSALGDQDWSRIDFTQFSKTQTPEYDFGLDAILDQFSN